MKIAVFFILLICFEVNASFEYDYCVALSVVEKSQYKSDNGIDLIDIKCSEGIPIQYEFTYKLTAQKSDNNIKSQINNLLNSSLINALCNDEVLSKNLYFTDMTYRYFDMNDEFITSKKYSIEMCNQKLTNNQHFSGVGIELEIKEDGAEVIRILPNSPSTNADIHIGDHIIMVNNESIIGLVLSDVINRIRGPENTEVILLVKQPKNPIPISIILKRTKINI